MRWNNPDAASWRQGTCAGAKSTSDMSHLGVDQETGYDISSRNTDHG